MGKQRGTAEVFTWGYWGWGSETKKLVEGVDAVERERGHEPPLFVDIRISRSVRAKGFNGAAFEKLLGPDRYVWLRGLGNDSIVTGGKRIKIHDSSAASDLLDLAVEAGHRNRRILFFCACEIVAFCHRKVAGDLLLAEARRRGVRLSLDEWPGREPGHVTVPVTTAILGQLQRGRKSVPLPKNADLAEYAGLPWGSVVEAVAGDEAALGVSGPAQVSGGKWQLPLFGDALFPSVAAARRVGVRMRRECGYGPRAAGLT